MRTLVASGLIASFVSVAAAQGNALDRAQIQAGIATVKAKVMGCGNGAKVGGTIKVKATVDAQGKVTAADATGDDSDLGACVAAEIKKATFAKTASGASFSYPFVFPKTGATSTNTRAKKPEGGKSAKPGPMPDDPLAPPQPESLDRAAITAGIAKVKARVMQCKGNAKVKATLKVAADGKVMSVTTDATDAKLGACVVAALKAATFGKSRGGGSFTYPFIFGTPPAPPAGQEPESSPPTGSTTTGLDRAGISDGIAKVKAKIVACGTSNPKAKGKVKMKVVVAPAGTVTTADVEASPDAALGKCVAGVLKTATFKATTQGGSFSYPFVF